MKTVGHIFPDGKVPLRHILGQAANISGHEGIFYFCDWSKLTPEQKEALVWFMTHERGIPEGEIVALLKESKMCIPIRSEIVSGVASTTPLKYVDLIEDPEEA